MDIRSKRFRLYGLLGAAGAVFGLGLSASPLTAAGARLTGHVPAVVPRLQPIGSLETTNQLQLAIGLPLRQPAILSQLLDELYDPASPRFRRFLTASQFSEQFGPSEEDYRTVSAYMASHGLRVRATHPNRVLLEVEGTVAAVEHAFHISLRVYPHPGEPRTFYAPDTEPELDQAMPILHISGLDDYFVPRPANIRVAPPRLGGEAIPAVGSAPGGYYAGGDFRKAYLPGVASTGTGQSVGLFELCGYYPKDIGLYEQEFGLTNIPVANVLLDGVTEVTQGADSVDGAEPALDIEMVISMAPGVAQVITYIGQQQFSPNTVLNRMATDNLAKQLSASWAFPADSTTAQIFQQMAAQGQSYFNSSADDGAYTDGAPSPIDLPFITVVGGTTLSTTSSGAWSAETAWNRGGTNGATGGGVSAQYPIPAWQQGINMQTNLGSTVRRNMPDVAMVADFVYIRYGNGSEEPVGGTSVSAPLWAGFMALVNQQAAAGGQPPVGFANPALYAIGKGSGYAKAFHDITTGNNFTPSSKNLYPAVAGYDLCTGWGTPNGGDLITAMLAPDDALHVTPAQGFTAITPFGVPFGPTNITFSLTNSLTASLGWSLVNTSAWLSASATGGVLSAGGPATSVTLSLNTGATAALPVGTYSANVLLANQSSQIAQPRLFTLIVSGANYPIMLTGFNAGVIVPNTAASASPQATAFDLTADYAFYQAGLTGGSRGLPENGVFVSQADGTTTFGFGPYGSNNVLLVGSTYPGSGTLSFSQPQSYSSLAILAASANGGGDAACVLNFADGSESNPFVLNAEDWETGSTNPVTADVSPLTNIVALKGFGRLVLPTWTFDDADASNPNLYQSSLNLAALGLNQPVVSITFTQSPSAQDTGVFAVSGSLMPAQVQIVAQPQSVTNDVPSQPATFTAVAMGTPPLACQWYYSPSGAATVFTPVAGQTNASLVLTNPQSSDAGLYYVQVTNDLSAATSAVVSLSVYRTPVIVSQPAPANTTLFAGRPFALSVVANAALPVFYAWNLDGTAIPVATNSTYSFNLDPTLSGTYTVVVSNAFGSVTSSPVALTVIPAPGYPYGQAVLADKPFGYWPLSETSGTVAHDYAAGDDGTYNKVILGQTGNSTLATHTAVRFGSPYGKNSYVGGIEADFSTAASAEFSVEVWVNAGAQGSTNGIITKGFGGQEQFCLDCGGTNNAFRFFVRDAAGNSYPAASTVVPNGRWHYLVGVCNQFQGSAWLYVDGTNAAHVAIKPGSGILASTNAVAFGSRQTTNGNYDLQLTGYLEEAALYSYGLSAAQVRAHFGVVTNGSPSFPENPIVLAPAYVGQVYASTLAGLASDSANDSLTFTKVSGPAWVSVAASGAVSGTPSASDAGTNTLEVSAQNPAGLSSSATVVFFVDSGPVFANDPFFAPAALIDQAYSASIAPSASDPLGVPLTFSLLSGPGWLFMDTAGELIGNPADINAGSNIFVVAATDLGGLSVTATMYLNVVRQGPSFIASTLTAPLAAVGQFYATTVASAASDPNGEPLTFSLAGGPSWLHAATNGVLSGTPQAEDAGLNSFSLVATDVDGLSATATLTISVQRAAINLAIVAQGGGLLLSWMGGSPPYLVQVNTDWLNPNWQNLGPPLLSTNLFFLPSGAVGFYRVLGQ